MSSLINDTNQCCGTGMAEALYLAWQELKKSPLPGALNLIVLFTDGQPSAVTIYANDPTENVMAGSSNCVNRNVANPLPAQRIIGALTLTGDFSGGSEAPYYSGNSVRGLYRDMQTTLKPPAPDVPRWLQLTGSEGGYGNAVGSSTQGCAAIDWPDANVSTDLARLPTRDAFGNATNSPGVNQARYYSQGGSQNLGAVTANYQTYLASWSAVDDAARRIRNDGALQPMIYTIGLTDLVDVPLMLRIANVEDRTNLAYDPAKPAGRYVHARNTTELYAAFESVAAEILRLTY
jgi:hypothetical protein